MQGQHGRHVGAFQQAFLTWPQVGDALRFSGIQMEPLAHLLEIDARVGQKHLRWSVLQRGLQQVGPDEVAIALCHEEQGRVVFPPRLEGFH